MKTIVKAHVGPNQRSMFDPPPTVSVEYTDGTKETLFQFFSDELSFSSGEFVGLTRDQAMAVRHKRDVAYLQS